MPPALTLRDVANSRLSRPLLSWLRTKTGIASGSLDHLRRSFTGLRSAMHHSHRCQLPLDLAHYWPTAGNLQQDALETGTKQPLKPEENRLKRKIPHVVFAFYSPHLNASRRANSPQKCNKLRHLGNSIAFFIDNPYPVDYDFFTPALNRTFRACGAPPRLDLW